LPRDGASAGLGDRAEGQGNRERRRLADHEADAVGDRVRPPAPRREDRDGRHHRHRARAGEQCEQQHPHGRVDELHRRYRPAPSARHIGDAHRRSLTAAPIGG
jgi:hypothetical protein